MHRPALTVAAVPCPSPVTSDWCLEAEAMMCAGLEMRTVALTLPPDSAVRCDLLACAEGWMRAARLRGVQHPAALLA